MTCICMSISYNGFLSKFMSRLKSMQLKVSLLLAWFVGNITV